MDAATVTEEQVVARIERLPISRWYARVISTVASAHFFDAFDSLTIAFVLPVLVGLWHITPGEIGWLISAGYVGQLIGALAFGWMAERFGRLKILQFSLGLIAIFAGACALAWNYSSFFWFRSIQGLGLGAEVPVAATYMNEFTKAKYRGRLIMSLQSMFGELNIFTSTDPPPCRLRLSRRPRLSRLLVHRTRRWPRSHRRRP
jgi:putative MFS transporter